MTDPQPPIAAVLRAMGEFLADAAEGQQLPPGLDLRVTGNIIEVLSRGRVIAQIDRSALIERAAEIGAAQN
jgi:hypothetical protein